MASPFHYFQNGVCSVCSQVLFPVTDCPPGYTGLMTESGVKGTSAGGCERCPEGSYCPVGGDRVPPVPCPSGKWCPPNVFLTLDCGPGTICTPSRTYFIVGPILCVAFIVFIVLISFLQRKYSERIAEKNAKVRRASGKHGNEDEENGEVVSPGGGGGLEVSQMSAMGEVSEYNNNNNNNNNNNIEESNLMTGKSREKLSGGRMRIDIINITYKLGGIRQRGKKILNGISCHFEPGKLSCIMGASGAGKTMLLTVLRGGISPSSGEIRVNNRVCDGGVSKYRDRIGFVPQDDDSLDDRATVREALEHSAVMRLPSRWSSSERSKLVTQVISVLGLDGVADTVIGTGSGASGGERGLSGGQRKRVSIGLELVAKPSCLLLDEPTSGLDSTTSLSVVRVLKKIASTGVNVIATIHQPSQLIFSSFDKLVLLLPGGRVAFAGETAAAVPYLRTLGMKRKKFVADPDLLLDFLNGVDIKSSNLHKFIASSNNGSKRLADDVMEGGGGGGGREFDDDDVDEEDDDEEEDAMAQANDAKSSSRLREVREKRTKMLAESWEENQQSRAGGAAAGFGLGANNDNNNNNSEISEKLKKRSTPWIPRQFLIQLQRLAVGIPRELSFVIVSCVVFLFSGAYLGMAFVEPKYALPIPSSITNFCPAAVMDMTSGQHWNQPCSPSWPSSETQGLVGMYFSFGVGTIAAAYSVKTLGEGKMWFYRQIRSGGSALALFVAKMVVDSFWSAVFALFFLSPYFLIAAPYGAFGEYFVLVTAFVFCNFGIGYLLSVFLSHQNAAIVATLAACVAGVTSGLVFQFSPVWPFYFSEGLFRSEATLVIDKASATDLPFIETYAKYLYGYEITKSNVILNAVLFNLYYGLGFRMIAFVGLVLWRRDLQK